MADVSDVEVGRMLHYLLNAGNRHYRYRYPKGWIPYPPYWNQKQVFSAFGITPRRGGKLLALYYAQRAQISPGQIDIVVRAVKRGHFNPAQILRIRNQTARREAMKAYGIERTVKNGGGILVQQDDYGTIWHVPGKDGADPFSRWVEVVNSTPETDGSYARYFLRVPPRTSTAKDAVAWIGDVPQHEFDGFLAQS